MTVKVTRGSVMVRPSDFLARDRYTRPTRLRTQDKPVLVKAGQTRSISFTGRFLSGGAILAWAPAGHRLVVWDFTVEID